ncbi:MAG: HD domain-containing protein [Pseudobdellovibrionaceae bacterium]|nr:HD domain-containing protein [Bdellovibrionales bacterium]USN46345.1 MAG: HD domain-containing protein [Pseudobdellovibrionaceae bacterium]
MASLNEANKQFVNQLVEKQNIESVFWVKDKSYLTDKNGKPYINLYLGDITGSINGRVWEKADEFVHAFDEGDFVFVKGHIQVFQKKKQMVVHQIRKAESSEYSLNDFMASAKRPVEAMMADLEKLVDEMKDPALKALVVETLTDKEVRPLFLKAPAAKTIHHAYVGGLLEHVLSIAQTMSFLAKHYTFLNYDYLLFGAIFHDIGKIWELSVEDGFQYTQRGRLVGHMVLACELVDKMSMRISDFTEDQRDICKHIILSHHGKLEYGSPKRPKLLEALVVAMIDEFDSKINSVASFMTSELENQSDWTRYEAQHDRYFYLPLFAEQLKLSGK